MTFFFLLTHRLLLDWLLPPRLHPQALPGSFSQSSNGNPNLLGDRVVIIATVRGKQGQSGSMVVIEALVEAFKFDLGIN